MYRFLEDIQLRSHYLHESDIFAKPLYLFKEAELVWGQHLVTLSHLMQKKAFILLHLNYTEALRPFLSYTARPNFISVRCSVDQEAS